MYTNHVYIGGKKRLINRKKQGRTRKHGLPPWTFLQYSGHDTGAEPGLFKGGGGILGLQTKKGGPGGDTTLGPMLKSLYCGQKNRGGASGPPPGSAHDALSFPVFFLFVFFLFFLWFSLF